MLNNIVLIGRLTKDPVLRKTQSNVSITSFTLAVDRDYKKEGQQECDFINCVAFNKTAEVIQQYQHKGDQLSVKGRLQVRNYDDQYGKRVYVYEVAVERVDFLGNKKPDQAVQYESPESEAPYIPDDKLPF